MTAASGGDRPRRAPRPRGDAPDVAPRAAAVAKRVYLVSYDLHAAHHDGDYALVERRIRGLGRSVRILYSQFLVQSERSASGVADYVAEVLGADDHLFVTAVSDDMAWRRISMGEERANKWRHAAGARRRAG